MHLHLHIAMQLGGVLFCKLPRGSPSAVPVIVGVIFVVDDRDDVFVSAGIDRTCAVGEMVSDVGFDGFLKRVFCAGKFKKSE
jgi:hypothetical protein